MSALDLKVFLHYGQYMLQQIGDRWDRQSADIILIHRLMKNSVKEKFGLRGYGLIMDAAVGAMGIAGLTDGMYEHTEPVDHFGEVRMFIHDLTKAWETHRKADRQMVTLEDALATAEAFVPIPQWLAWDLSFDNDVKKRYLFLDEHIRVGDANARIETGSTFHCFHGGGGIEYVIADMEAPNHVTKRNVTENSLTTYKYKSVEGGMLFSTLFRMLDPNLTISDEDRQATQAVAESVVKKFAQIVDEEIAAGRIQPEQLKEIEGIKDKQHYPGVEQGRFAELAGKNS